MTAETIAAVATPPGKGAISIVRVSGPMAPQLAKHLFRAKGALRARVASYGTIVDEAGHPIDRGLALLARAPHSYTGEDTVEFQVHGSPAVVREVMRALIASGARQAQPGEFTRRAFLNGKLDLHEAGAIADLIDAETRSAARAALANLGGGLTNTVRNLRAALQRALEELAASIDFPDEVPEPDRGALARDIGYVTAELQRLLRTGEAARIVREGVPVAIVGPPNAGKSSLLNALLGEERALVSEIAGTTRDTIEESIALDGLQFRLIDTAGIRSHADRLEAAGIERTAHALAGSRIALVVIDGSVPLGAEARAVLERTEGRDRVIFCNKADIATVAAGQLPQEQTVVGSARDAESIRVLGDALSRAVTGADAPDLERPHLAAAAEFDAVAEALQSLERAHETLGSGAPADLASADLQRAYAALGRLTGDQATEDLLTAVFARFCIGK